MLGDVPLGAITPSSGVLTPSVAINGVNIQSSSENPLKVEKKRGDKPLKRMKQQFLPK